MRTVFLALAAYLPQLAGQLVVLMSDKATVVEYLWNQGSTVSRVICDLAFKVVLWTEIHSVTIGSVHSRQEECLGGSVESS